MCGRFGHFFLFLSPSPSFAPYSAFAGCFKSASHKKSLSQWNTAIWEIIEWWLGGTNASLRNYTTISPAFTTFLKASCHPGRKSPRLKIHYIFKPAWWHGSLIPRCNTTAHSSHSSYANTKAVASLCLSHFTFLQLFSSLFVKLKTADIAVTKFEFCFHFNVKIVLLNLRILHRVTLWCLVCSLHCTYGNKKEWNNLGVWFSH